MCCSPEQLILLDDPAFLPETALPALEFDFSSLKPNQLRGSQQSPASSMSIHNHSSSTPFALGDIQLPSSSTHAGQHQLPLNDPFIGSSAQRFGVTENVRLDEEGEYFQDDMIFEFDDNGEMRDIDESERQAQRAGRLSNGHPGHDSAGSPRVRKERAGAIDNEVIRLLDQDGDFGINLYEDDMQALPDAEQFPMMSGGLGGNDRPQNLRRSEDRESFAPDHVVSNAAGAAPKSRKAKSRQAFGVDRIVELRNSDLSKWQTEYNHTMADERRQALQRKTNSQAKKKAFWFVYGTGLNSVGYGVGAQMAPSPLNMFLGESLVLKITGQPMPSAVSKSKKSKRAAELEVEEQVTPKRVRTAQHDTEIGLGHLGDEGPIMMEDGSMAMEIGREAPSALADHPSSTVMPWNVSVSLNSYQRGASSSQLGRGHGSAGRRGPSASPLVGRGSTMPGPLEHFSWQEDKITYGRDDELGHDIDPSLSQVEFEVFGPAAQVDTQTAGDSQWVRDILAREAGNFFDYVLNTISEKAGDELDDDEMEVGMPGQGMSVTFEELFDPRSNSQIVAAQAFYHVLTLATRSRVWVEQDGEMEPFGSIRIGITAQR
jgi:meiotic recombination protein REC8